MVRRSCRSVPGFRDGCTHLRQHALGVRRAVDNGTNPNDLKGDTRDTVESLLDRQNTMLAGHPFDADFTLVHTGSVLLDMSFVPIVLI
jgi:hypothetical protein